MLRTLHRSHTGLFFAACVAVMTSCIVSAQQAPRQHAWELSASMITLPPSDPGILSALPCSSCTTVSFSTGAGTRYRVGENVITLAELRSLFARYPKAFVVVFVGDDFRTVETVTMSASVLAQ